MAIDVSTTKKVTLTKAELSDAVVEYLKSNNINIENNNYNLSLETNDLSGAADSENALSVTWDT